EQNANADTSATLSSSDSIRCEGKRCRSRSQLSGSCVRWPCMISRKVFGTVEGADEVSPQSGRVAGPPYFDLARGTEVGVLYGRTKRRIEILQRKFVLALVVNQFVSLHCRTVTHAI